MTKHKLFNQLAKLTTEERNRKSARIDMLIVEDALKIINNEDRVVPAAVGKEIYHIARAVKLVERAFRSGGRLIYVGAGTSGRLGVLDAAECPPTYGTRPTMVRGIIAGGNKAVFRSQEGAEDKQIYGERDVKTLKVNERDIVCGIAASMRTPYVAGALREAKKRNAKTIFVTTNPRSKFTEPEFLHLKKVVDVAICPVVGPEVIMGSTRMKSGTAQKLVLNMITTTAMIRLGKVYENMMVDLKMNSRKLEERAKRILMISTGTDYHTASNALVKAGGHVKTAIVMIKANVNRAQSQARLIKANGFVRQAIGKNSSQQ